MITDLFSITFTDGRDNDQTVGPFEKVVCSDGEITGDGEVVASRRRDGWFCEPEAISGYERVSVVLVRPEDPR
jgi:hypothetical protein